MPRASFRLLTGVLFLALQPAACGGGENAEVTSGDTAAGADSAAVVTPAPATELSAEASMTVEDIDRWQRGMAAELTAVREAGAKFKAARSSTDSLSAMMAANETSTRAAGARAAGVEENRYGLIGSTLSSIVRYMTPLEAELDVRQMPADMLASMKRDREQTVARLSTAFPPAVIEALRPRAAELRKQQLALTGERLKAAGMGR
ncbi:MAG: hypothetical protein WD825_05810 [Gemmatimonadaceae bacterium]